MLRRPLPRLEFLRDLLRIEDQHHDPVRPLVGGTIWHRYVDRRLTRHSAGGQGPDGELPGFQRPAEIDTVTHVQRRGNWDRGAMELGVAVDEGRLAIDIE